MLRVFKPTLPMSVGSWLLSGYGPLAIGAAAAELTDSAPRLGRLATTGAAVMGPAIAAYTGTLLADSSIPAWHGVYRELPFLFVSSAACAATGAGLLAGNGEGTSALVRLGIAGAAGDVGLARQMERRLGPSVARPYQEGKSGRRMKLSRVFTVSAVVSAVAAEMTTNVPLRRVAVALFLAGSATTRFGVFYAGVASANDPAATITPQRTCIIAGTT